VPGLGEHDRGRAAVDLLATVRPDLDAVLDPATGLLRTGTAIRCRLRAAGLFTCVLSAPRGGRATIVVRREARRVCCSVRDDGVGFDPGTARPTAKGIGLIGIRERLFAVGGALSIDAAPGRGTELRVAIPLLKTH